MRESFFISFFSLARLSLGIDDKFLRIKLIKQISRFFDCFSKIEKREGDNVAQSSRVDLLKVVDDIIEFIETLSHLKIVELSPALLVQKNLLSFKSKVLDFKTATAKQTRSQKRRETSPKNSGEKNFIGEKILTFIRSHGEATSREIVSAFAGRVPKRTIQRHLARLVKSERLTKNGTHNITVYDITQ